MPTATSRPRPPAPIPYQGSKRRLASAILAFVPEGRWRLHEPFCGSAAVSLAALAGARTANVLLNDADRALAELWRAVVGAPDELGVRYRTLWNAQCGRPRAFYDECRAEFNLTRRPDLLLFLLARCAKAAVRYNARGEFNQSPDNRRLGAHPDRVVTRLRAAAALLAGRVEVTADDYTVALGAVEPGDVVYLDPPYEGVSSGPDRRYQQPLDREAFLAALDASARRGVAYLLSFDGRTGARAYGTPLPPSFGMRVELEAGTSSQATLLGRRERTVESLYLSPALVERLGGSAGVAALCAGAAVPSRLVPVEG